MEQESIKNLHLSNDFINLREAEENETILSVGAYNILADSNAIHQYFSYVNEEFFSFEYRAPRIIEQIKQLNSDIYILSELDRYEDYYKAEFSKIGYELIFTSKTRKGKTEGTGIAYKISKFELLEEIYIDYDNEFKLADIRTHNKGNVGLLLMLWNNDLKIRILASGTHLFWDKKLSHLQFTQISCLLNKITEITDKYKEFLMIIILGGDLNSGPESNVVRRITNNKLGYEADINVMDGIKEVLDIYGQEGGNMRSGYEFYMGRDKGIDQHPHYTTHKPSYSGCVDFLFFNTTPRINMEVIKMLKIPDVGIVTKELGLPNQVLPSDHLLIATKFAIKID